MNNTNYHYLTKTPGGLPPKRFLSLGYATEDCRTSPDGTGPEVRICKAWSLGLYSGTTEKYGVENVWFGQSPHELHRILKHQTRFKGQLDLWCIGAMSMMGCLAFWQYIEDGIWLTKKGKWTGTVIVSDPPVSVSLQGRTGNGTLRILGLENLGIWSDTDLGSVTQKDAVDRISFTKAHESPADYADVVSSSVGWYVMQWHHNVARQKLGSIKTTIAGQSRAAFRHRFLRFPLLCHRNAEATRLEESAIMQGRTECFRLGHVNGPVYHLDFQSFYPCLLRDEPMPARMKYVEARADGDIRLTKYEGYYLIANVRIDTDSPHYPHVNDIGQVFPIGKFETTLCEDELYNGILLGDVMEISQVAAYEPEVIFREWVDWCLHLRAEAKKRGDRVAEMVAKLLTNSLWGSFAKRKRLWETVKELQPVQPWAEWFERELVGGPLEHYRSIGWLGQRLVDYGFDDDALPAITAAINSAGRFAMLGIIETAGRSHCYYVSTDSLLCDEIAMNRLATVDAIRENCPGKLRVVDVSEWVRINGIHAVETQFGTTSAGVPEHAKIDELGNSEWRAMEKISGALKRGQTPGANIVVRNRGTVGNYKHGEVMQDGTVKPLRLEDW